MEPAKASSIFITPSGTGYPDQVPAYNIIMIIGPFPAWMFIGQDEGSRGQQDEGRSRGQQDEG